MNEHLSIYEFVNIINFRFDITMQMLQVTKLAFPKEKSGIWFRVNWLQPHLDT